MKTYPAIAALEFDDIAVGVSATDAMLKKAPIAFFRSGTITRGRYLTIIGGTTASVEESASEGTRHAASNLLGQVVLADVHPRLYEAVLGDRRPTTGGALAIFETTMVSASIRGAEGALKGTPVELIEIRLADTGLAGKGVFVLEGALHDIEAAVALVTARLRSVAAGLSYRVIPAPHEAITAQLARGTFFASSLLIELDGETV